MAYVDEVLADSPTSYWRLGEASGTVAVDRMGINDGTYTNTPTLGVTGALTGSVDTAVTFTGAQSESVDLPAFTVGTDATFEAWFKTATTGTVFSQFHTVNASRIDILLTPRLVVELRNDAGTTGGTFEDGFLDDNQWHHVVLVKTGSSWELFVAGASAATKTLAGTFTFDSAAIGRNPGSGQPSYFTGTIDEVAIYPTALSSTRVAAHFDAFDDVETPVIVTAEAFVANVPLVGGASFAPGLYGPGTDYLGDMR